MTDRNGICTAQRLFNETPSYDDIWLDYGLENSVMTKTNENISKQNMLYSTFSCFVRCDFNVPMDGQKLVDFESFRKHFHFDL